MRDGAEGGCHSGGGPGLHPGSGRESGCNSVAAFTRRDFVVGGAGAAALVALGLGVRRVAAVAAEPALLRPPGAQDEDAFLGACVRCDRCRSICPHDCIAVASVDDGLLVARTPVLNFRIGYCDFCEGEYLCRRACPLEAFSAFDERRDKIGLAVIDRDECLAYDVGGGCQKCVTACAYEAIILNGGGRPEVVGEACNGCGLCEFICPSASLRDGGGRGIVVKPA